MNLVSEIQSSEGIPYIECTLGKEGNTQYLCGNFFFWPLIDLATTSIQMPL